jgi:hypothetical protein
MVHQHDRSSQDVTVRSFQGEWATPKDLQLMKETTCPTCNQSIEVNYLVQPNETKRRSQLNLFLFHVSMPDLPLLADEEILQKIRDRNAGGTNKKLSNDPTSKSSSVTQQWVSPV